MNDNCLFGGQPLTSTSLLWTAASAGLISQDCQLCGASTDNVICAPCLRDLPFRADQGCQCCGDAVSVIGICGACISDPPDFDSTLCAFTYEFPIDRLLQAFKFQAKLVLDQLLVDAMVRQIEVHFGASGMLPELIVPMPLARRRLAERGFNQSVVLGRALAARFNLAFADDVLVRVRDTRPQAGLKRVERKKNVRNAFSCVEPGIFHGRHVALVDDVMTTGATMSAAASALKMAGAARVDAWALARAIRQP
jgi:ComF family protein